MERLVGEFGDVGQAIQMPYRCMQVHRLHRVAAAGVDHVVPLCQTDQVLEVLAVADTPTALQIRAIGRAGNLRKREVLATDLQVALRVAGMQGELGRTGLDLIQNQSAIKPHAFGTCTHIRSGLFKDFTRAFVHEVHAHLFEDGQGRSVNRLEFVLGNNRSVRKAMFELAVFGGRWRDPDGAAGPTGSTPSGRRGCGGFRHGLLPEIMTKSVQVSKKSQRLSAPCLCRDVMSQTHGAQSA